MRDRKIKTEQSMIQRSRDELNEVNDQLKTLNSKLNPSQDDLDEIKSLSKEKASLEKFLKGTVREKINLTLDKTFVDTRTEAGVKRVGEDLASSSSKKS